MYDCVQNFLNALSDFVTTNRAQIMSHTSELIEKMRGKIADALMLDY